jgi:hypothetical protein
MRRWLSGRSVGLRLLRRAKEIGDRLAVTGQPREQIRMAIQHGALLVVLGNVCGYLLDLGLRLRWLADLGHVVG